MTPDFPDALPETRQKAIQATRRHILDVKAGKIRLRAIGGKEFTSLEDYIKEEMQRLNLLIGEVGE